MFENAFHIGPVRYLADLTVLLYLAVAVGMLWVSKQIYEATAGYRLNEQLTDRDNKAVAISFAGFLFALCMIIGGVLISPESLNVDPENNRVWIKDLINVVLWAGLGCLLLIGAQLVNDKFIFPKFSNKKELVEDRNMGMGAAQAGSFIATALIIDATIAGGELDGIGKEMMLTVIWFVLSQILMLLFSMLYQRYTAFDLHKELERDNAAAGVAFGGTLIAFGLLLGFYIVRFESLLGLVIWAMVSGLLLTLVRIGVDRLILPGSKLDKEISTDKNWGAALIEIATAIGAALIISGSFN